MWKLLLSRCFLYKPVKVKWNYDLRYDDFRAPTSSVTLGGSIYTLVWHFNCISFLYPEYVSWNLQPRFCFYGGFPLITLIQEMGPKPAHVSFWLILVSWIPKEKNLLVPHGLSHLVWTKFSLSDKILRYWDKIQAYCKELKFYTRSFIQYILGLFHRLALIQ